MDLIWVALAALTFIIVIVVVVAGGVVLFLRMRAHESINFDLRVLFRVYLLVVIVAGLLVFTQGASNLIQAGFATLGSNQFSYDPVYIRLPSDSAPQPQTAVELKDRTQLTDVELEELADIETERRIEQIAVDEERRRLGLDRAKKEGLIQGISFLIIGLLIWLSHLAARRWLETGEERASLLNRIYLIVVTIVFGIITIVLMPQAVFETFSYVVLDPVDSFGSRTQPGDKLALAITTLPVWLIYLFEVVRSMRRATA
jgi:hypothetical protein